MTKRDIQTHRTSIRDIMHLKNSERESLSRAQINPIRRPSKNN